MNPNLHEFVIERLAAARGNWPEVARGSGVALRTLEKIFRREIVDPGVSHVQKLANYFLAQDDGHPRRRSEDHPEAAP